MKINFVSDVHGRSHELRSIGDDADAVVCLGDLLLYLDYDDPTQGAYSKIFGSKFAAEYIRLRLNKQFDKAREMTAKAWEQRVEQTGEEDRFKLMSKLAAEQYDEILGCLPEPAFLTFGNVDIPQLGQKYLRPGHTVVDGDVVEVGGVRIGIIGGGLVSPYRTPNELEEEDFNRKVDAVIDQGPVDILAAHIPPSIPEITFDVVAQRLEVGSKALLRAIEVLQPKYNVFGHVHQPLYSRTRVGKTECLNVGHFRNRRTPFQLEL